MRCKTKFSIKKELYNKGVREQICQHFLFFPLTINGECRWLETATYVEKLNYEQAGCDIDGYSWPTSYWWTQEKWIDDPSTIQFLKISEANKIFHTFPMDRMVCNLSSLLPGSEG